MPASIVSLSAGYRLCAGGGAGGAGGAGGPGGGGSEVLRRRCQEMWVGFPE